ncbi:efflux RND transporter permease subunit [Anaeromyxobacter oryzae]|uniref:RND transporter n=1 Tax=Anaeromyxobacter oryzae TaxID=2918170 RepID=A0ABM7X1A8_9BACT|nr:efflux RND transporter permease subunit [Anaeromyxobacter oryzae]BDG05587.1 RND transporter [Anaeromyxobacter oryzae]
MWIVRLALRRPYTIVVLAIMILLLGALAVLTTPKDIFPSIDIPVVSVLWSYNGLSADEMAARIVTVHERALTTTVNDIEHMESQSLDGIAVEKIFFQPGAQVANAVAQVTSTSQAVMRQMPPGATPPLVITYSASSVPVLQLALSGNGLSEQQLNDFAVNFVRTDLATVRGASVPFPYGGKIRQVQVDLDNSALQAKGMSPLDVVNAISAQNLILPAGTAKIGSLEYDVDLNGSPRNVAVLNDLPIKTMPDGSTLYVRDVANVRDGSPPQTNIVRVDGQRSSLLTVQKFGSASTLDVIGRVRALLPRIQAGLPQALRIEPLADQSIFVRAAIQGVLREALIAACLTGFMILVFLGSWRSTLIIAASIPLSILSSIAAMSALGQTLNIMTLGGLALAVGILVDDATVEIENINRNLDQGKELETAILDGAREIAVPALVSTLSICIVFVPMFFHTGVARFLFVPLAEAVVFAMIASYVLSRTLVPTMARHLLGRRAVERTADARRGNPFQRAQAAFEARFEGARDAYHRVLEACLARRLGFVGAFLAFCVGSLALIPWLGQDFFPSTDGGQLDLHLRARTGTRIEETARLTDEVEKVIRQTIPSAELRTVVDDIGVPYSGINLSYSTSAPIGTSDADVLVTLGPDHHPTDGYVHDLRLKLRDAFPGVEFAFLPADMVSQILNFGLPAPIDVQVVGRDREGNRRLADVLLHRLREVPGMADVRIQQKFDRPRLHLSIDRTKLNQVGFTQREAATNVLVSLSGSFQTSPTFWLDPKSGVSYPVAIQTPQQRLQSLQDLETIPITGASGRAPQLLGSVASVVRQPSASVASDYDIQPVLDIYGSVQGRDLGGVSRDVERIVKASASATPRGTRVVVRGQVATMNGSYTGLLAGLCFAIVLVYLLIVVNFQSWLDPFIIVATLPAALAGIVWFLFVTRTTVSVPALTGAIMCMGVATANSILVVQFAKESLAGGASAAAAALQAGVTRFRPVLMTALAMIIGMAPMALGLGEGGEQNAPLGRAVIGGLMLATVSTLLFVPAVFSAIHGARTARAR